MTNSKRRRRSDQWHARNAQRPGKKIQIQKPQNELFVPWPHQEHNEQPQYHTLQATSRMQTTSSSRNAYTHTAMSPRSVPDPQVPKRGNPREISQSYNSNPEGRFQGASSRCANYKAADVPMDLTMDGDHSRRRSVASRPKNNQKCATRYTEQSSFPQENCGSGYEEPTHYSHVRWNKHRDDPKETPLWANTAVTIMAEGLEDEILIRKMQKRMTYLMVELQEMCHVLHNRSPYHKAKIAVHQMMDENSDDHEGMRIVSRKLDDAARELGRL